MANVVIILPQVTLMLAKTNSQPADIADLGAKLMNALALAWRLVSRSHESYMLLLQLEVERRQH